MILQDIQVTIELDTLTPNSYQDLMDILQRISIEDVRSTAFSFDNTTFDLDSFGSGLTEEQEKFVESLTI